MSEQAGTTGAGGSGVFTRGFLPGLVLGIVVGAAVGFLSTEVIGKSPPKVVDGEARMVVEDGSRDDRGESQMTREEMQRLAEEAARQAVEEATEAGGEAGGGEQTPEADPAPADGND